MLSKHMIIQEDSLRQQQQQRSQIDWIPLDHNSNSNNSNNNNNNNNNSNKPTDNTYSFHDPSPASHPSQMECRTTATTNVMSVLNPVGNQMTYIQSNLPTPTSHNIPSERTVFTAENGLNDGNQTVHYHQQHQMTTPSVGILLPQQQIKNVNSDSSEILDESSNSTSCTLPTPITPVSNQIKSTRVWNPPKVKK
uniref:Uncharacterized protein n=1 Tax=Trichobilharzia regenti TaxID=157069 RepID=A0AA85J235_TRIRE